MYQLFLSGVIRMSYRWSRLELIRWTSIWTKKFHAIKSLFESETQIIEKDSHYFYPFCISTYLHIKLKTFSIQNIAFLTSVTIFLLSKHVVKVGKQLPFRRKTVLYDSKAWNKAKYFSWKSKFIFIYSTIGMKILITQCYFKWNSFMYMVSLEILF